jgi:ribosomal protein S6
MENDVLNEQISKEPQIYEASYLFVPSLTPERAEEEVAAIKAEIAKLGGNVISSGETKNIELAYEMAKIVGNKKTMYKTALFGWLKFDIIPEKAEVLNKNLEANDDIIRFLLIKTIKDIPLVRRSVSRRIQRKPEVVEKKGKVDEKELEKEIEGLLTTS